MSLQPTRQGFRCSICQQINDLVTLPVNEQRPIFHPSTKHEIIYTKDLRDTAFHGWACPGETQEGIRTHRCSHGFEQSCYWFASTLKGEDHPQKR
jgi:hypothetical protein